MEFTAGMMIGPYQIVAPLGAGGMGVVYRAHDAALQRDVALKMLPERFASDPERLARFQREAQVLASLNHPNIAQIYGLQGTGASRCIVMELVEGDTLEERLRRGPIPIDEALPIAKQIADALEAAHERAIVHRDLKPANIKQTPEGRVKVLDFGLAKALAGAPTGESLSNSPTLSMAGTQAGVILGTAAYMSPEQAKGKDADHKSDVWAFGCVLYEMLTGARAFDGDDVTEVLAAVIRAEPDWRKLPAETPPEIRRLLRRCIVKDRRERLPDIAMARLEIKDVQEAPAEPQIAPVVARRKGLLDGARLGWALAAVALLVAFALRVAMPFRVPADARVYRTSILPPDNAAWAGIPQNRFRLSPDGRRLAFLATDASRVTQLWVRSLDGLAAQPLAGTAAAVTALWSPDSRYLAFVAGGKLKKIDASGGPPLTLADVATNWGGTWNQDDVILFLPTGRSPVHRVSASGGKPSPVTTLDAQSGDIVHAQPFFLPDGRHFLYTAIGSRTGGPSDVRGVYVGSLDPAEKGRLLIEGGSSNAQYASGYVFFVRETTLMAQRFDVARLELNGEAAPVAEQIQIGGTSALGGAVSVSQTGVLVYQTGLGDVRSQLTWFDRTGKQAGVVGDQADYGDLELSRDRKRAAVSLLDPAQRTRDAWLFDLARGLRTRFTFDPADEFNSVWSADGTRVVFNSRRKGHLDLYQKASNGAGDEEVLLADDVDKHAVSWSSDGRFIINRITATSTTRSVDLWILPLSGDRKPFPYLQTRFNEVTAQFSPDSRWVAYVSNESGRNEVYVGPFPEPRGKWQISTAGGHWPRWSPDGKEIFYLAADNKLMAAEVNGRGAGFEVGAVRPLFETSPKAQGYPYDVSADGQRFLINTLVEEASSTPITLLVNWPALLKK